MALTEYVYSVSTDFPNSKVNTDKLTYQIDASSIVTALDRIDVIGDACNIWFKDALSSGDETTLDGIVAAHDGNPLVTTDSTIIRVKETDTDGLDPDVANTQLKGYKFTATGKASTGVAGKWTDYDFSYSYDVDLLMGEGQAPPDGDDDDMMEFLVAPDTIIGQLASGAVSGASGVYGNVTALSNLKPGYYARFGDTSDLLHELTDIDYATGEITVSPVLDEDKSQDDYVLRTIKYCDTIHITPGEELDLGGQTHGSVNIPKSTSLRVRYYNTQLTDTIVKFRIVLKY